MRADVNGWALPNSPFLMSLPMTMSTKDNDSSCVEERSWLIILATNIFSFPLKRTKVRVVWSLISLWKPRRHDMVMISWLKGARRKSEFFGWWIFWNDDDNDDDDNDDNDDDAWYLHLNSTFYHPGAGNPCRCTALPGNTSASSSNLRQRQQTRSNAQGPRPASARWLRLAHENVFAKFPSARLNSVLWNFSTICLRPLDRAHFQIQSTAPSLRLPTSNCSLGIVY